MMMNCESTIKVQSLNFFYIKIMQTSDRGNGVAVDVHLLQSSSSCPRTVLPALCWTTEVLSCVQSVQPAYSGGYRPNNQLHRKHQQLKSDQRYLTMNGIRRSSYEMSKRFDGTCWRFSPSRTGRFWMPSAYARTVNPRVAKPATLPTRVMMLN